MVATNQRSLGRNEPDMMIVGCDYHTGFQQVAFVDTDTAELRERRLQHREETFSRLRGL